MEYAEQAQSPSNEELEADSTKRFESYQAIKAAHERRKNELKRTLEREERRIQQEKQCAETRLDDHHKEHATAVENEDQLYHAELKEAKGVSGLEAWLAHNPSIEEMEAEEVRLFEASQHARKEHERRVTNLNQCFESVTTNIQKQMDELGQKSSRCLEEHTTAMEDEDQRYMEILKDFKRQNTPNWHHLSQRSSSRNRNASLGLSAEGPSAERSSDREKSPDQPRPGCRSRYPSDRSEALGTPFGDQAPSRQHEHCPPQPASTEAPSASPPQTPSPDTPFRSRIRPPTDVPSGDRNWERHKMRPEFRPANRATEGKWQKTELPL